MASIFSKLPNDLIIKIIRIENDRRKYDKVVEQINVVTTYDKGYGSIREYMNDAVDYDPESMSTLYMNEAVVYRPWSKPVLEMWACCQELSWLNDCWWHEIQRLKNERKKREKERMKYGEVIRELNGLLPVTYYYGSNRRIRLPVFITVYGELNKLMGWERPEWRRLLCRYGTNTFFVPNEFC